MADGCYPRRRDAIDIRWGERWPSSVVAGRYADCVRFEQERWGKSLLEAVQRRRGRRIAAGNTEQQVPPRLVKGWPVPVVWRSRPENRAQLVGAASYRK